MRIPAANTRVNDDKEEFNRAPAAAIPAGLVDLPVVAPAPTAVVASGSPKLKPIDFAEGSKAVASTFHPPAKQQHANNSAGGPGHHAHPKQISQPRGQTH